MREAKGHLLRDLDGSRERNSRSPSVVFLSLRKQIMIRNRDIVKLKKLAYKSPLKRARYCLHIEGNRQVQDMVIALCRGSYIRPFRQKNMSKSFHMIQGRMMIVTFDRSGRITNRDYVSSASPRHPCIYRFRPNRWHSIIALTPYAVFHEYIEGPHYGAEYAKWSPAADDPDRIKNFMSRF